MILLSQDVTDVRVVDPSESKRPDAAGRKAKRSKGAQNSSQGKGRRRAKTKSTQVANAMTDAGSSMDLTAPINPMEKREKVHIVEHKRFSNDTRRHFVGEVESFDSNHIRIHGYPFVFDADRGKFVRIQPMRTCVFSTDNNIGITILPDDFDIEKASYSRQGGDFVFEDGNQHSIEIGAYSNVA